MVFLSFPRQILIYYVKEVTKASSHIFYQFKMHGISFLPFGYAQSTNLLTHLRSLEKPQPLLYYLTTARSEEGMDFEVGARGLVLGTNRALAESE
jgi:hypothetical protein